ncbi:MAG: AAA-type ATPase lid domain-containing protein [bacterium]
MRCQSQEKVLNILLDYNYPGNIRELKNIIEFMVAVSANVDIINDTILPAYLNDLKYKNNLSNDKNNGNEEYSNNIINGGEGKEDFIKIPFNMNLEDAENLIILKTLLNNSNDKVKTSKALNIGLKTLYRKLETIKSLKP